MQLKVIVECPRTDCKAPREFNGIEKRLRTISTCKCKKCGEKFNPHDALNKILDENAESLRPKVIKYEVEWFLMDSEKLGLSHLLTEALSKISRAQDNLKSYKAQISSEVSAYEAEKNRIVKLLSSGKEMRRIDCEVSYDWKKKLKLIIRKDTGELVAEGPIPEAELQEELSL